MNLNSLLSALVYDVVAVVKSENDFFAKSASERLALAETTKTLPIEIAKFLSEANEKDFFDGLSQLMARISQSDLYGKMNAKMVLAFADFCVNQLANLLEEFHMNKKSAFAGIFGEYLDLYFSSTVDKEILESVQSFVAEVYDSPYVLVQTPLILDLEKRIELRSALSQKYKHSIPVFSVNKNLIGGMRIFVDGETHDHSWIGKINQINSIIKTK